METKEELKIEALFIYIKLKVKGQKAGLIKNGSRNQRNKEKQRHLIYSTKEQKQKSKNIYIFCKRNL